MGIYTRENGIFYLKIQVYINGIQKYKRISLGTIKEKITPTKFIHKEPTTIIKENTKIQHKKTKKYNLENIYLEYIDLCKSQ